MTRDDGTTVRPLADAVNRRLPSMSALRGSYGLSLARLCSLPSVDMDAVSIDTLSEHPQFYASIDQVYNATHN